MSTALDILNAVAARLGVITVAGGFNTNIGLSAEVNFPRLNPDEVTVNGTVVVFDTTENNLDGDSMVTDYTVQNDLIIEAYVVVSGLNAVTLAHQMIEDIKKAVQIPTNRTLDGLAMQIEYTGREIEYPRPGSDIVSVKMSYYTRNTEIYGSP